MNLPAPLTPEIGGDSLFLSPKSGGTRSSSPQDWGVGGAEALFRDGLCLPSGSRLTAADLMRVAAVIRSLRKSDPWLAWCD